MKAVRCSAVHRCAVQSFHARALEHDGKEDLASQRTSVATTLSHPTLYLQALLGTFVKLWSVQEISLGHLNRIEINNCACFFMSSQIQANSVPTWPPMAASAGTHPPGKNQDPLYIWVAIRAREAGGTTVPLGWAAGVRDVMGPHTLQFGHIAFLTCV